MTCGVTSHWWVNIFTNPEVSLAMDARNELQGQGIPTRVVSMPSMVLFERQPRAYQDEVLPPGIRARVSIEAGSPMGWHRWVGTDGAIVGLSRFGASAPAKRVFQELGFSVDNVVATARGVLGMGNGQGDRQGADAAGPARFGVDEK